MEKSAPPDLHAEPTRILTRNAQPVPPLHELATRILDPRTPSLHELPTALKPLPELHGMETQIKMRPGAPVEPPQGELPELPPLGQMETRILTRNQVDTRAGTIANEETTPVHETEPQPLVELDEDELGLGDMTAKDGGPTTVEDTGSRLRHDTAPQTPVEDSGSVPLSDEDLEPG